MKVICISGKAQHGKDTTAGYLKEFLEPRGKKVLIAHYGDLVKYICKTFFNWDGQKDEKGRTLLQVVGTDRIRVKEPDYWCKFICDILHFFPDEWDYVLIPDCRFPNEVTYLKDHGLDVTHVRIVRETPGWVSPLTEEQRSHPSETALDGYPYDWCIHNDHDLSVLWLEVQGLADAIMHDRLQNHISEAEKYGW